MGCAVTKQGKQTKEKAMAVASWKKRFRDYEWGRACYLGSSLVYYWVDDGEMPVRLFRANPCKWEATVWLGTETIELDLGMENISTRNIRSVARKCRNTALEQKYAQEVKQAEPQTKDKSMTGRKMSEEEEHELAVALENYTNPEHPEFDIDFSIEIMRLRPDWFSDAERERVAKWAAERRENR